MFDVSIEVPITIRDPKQADRHTRVHRDGTRRRRPSLDRSNDRRRRTTPRSALDRITIPQDVLDRVAPTALPRSSIIISDEPLSAETNYRTEFVAVLSNHPQGGFVTRSPTAFDRIMADDGFSSFRRAQPGSSYWEYQTSPQRWRSQPGNWQRGW